MELREIREIIDNTDDNKLLNFLETYLKEFPNSNLDIATAYFNVGAYLMLRNSLKNVKRFRLLIGRAPKLKKAESLGEELLKRLKKELEKLEFTRDNEEGIRDFIEFLKKDNVEVRLYENFLHGKAYIFDKLVIIGSSNFTPSGLTRMGELNSVSLESYARYTREVWFEKFWNEAKDFKKELIELLENSKFGIREYTPYEIFIKAIYELQKEDIKTKEDQGKIQSRVELTEFQEDAIPRIYSRLKKYGGILIADSVGLGKTWIAKRIIEDFGFYKRKNFLVICPAQLREGLWKKELKDILLAENIISLEELSLDDFMTRIEKTIGGKSNFKDIGLIVVDESHNLRNPLSKRWEHFLKLYEEIINNGGSPYIVFLTATPINNTIWDLYWQILLLVGMNDSAFIKVGIKSLYEFFKEIEKKGDFLLLNDILNEISIRRTRDYIIKNYPKATINGKEIKFPKRILENISYSLEKTYSGMYKKITDIIINKLTLAGYNLIEYKKREKLSQEEKQEIQRMIALSGILKTILLKRFESSVEAFRKSIDRQITFLTKLEDFLKRGKRLTKKAFDKYILKADEEIENIESDDVFRLLEDINLEDYDTERLFSDIENDLRFLKEIKSFVEDITPEKDSKLNTVIEYLKKLHKKGQIIIFTYYEDTLDYLFNEIRKSKELSGLRIEKISGSTPINDRNIIIEEFTKKNIDILLSTDVLSEGMNLQSAKILFNYDLHWNPVKMLQRTGRIDRIGSPYDEIIIYNVFPEKELEDLLKLVETLQKKIREIDETIGLDQSILGEKIHPKVFGVIRKIIGKDTSVFEELETDIFGGGEKFYQPLRDFINQIGVEEIEKIPLGVHSGLRKGSIRGIFFYYKYGEDMHFWYLYDIEKNRIIKRKTEIIDYIACRPDEKRFIPEFFDKIYEINEKIVSEIEREYREIEQELRDPKIGILSREKSTAFIRKMIREINSRLEIDSLSFSKDEYINLIEIWNKIIEKLPNIYLTKSRLKELRKMWKEYERKQNLKNLIHSLNIFLKDIPLRKHILLAPFKKEKLKLVVVDFIS